jgi:hypothetical protein
MLYEPSVPFRRCPTCGIEYHASPKYFGKQKGHLYGLSSYCRTCTNAHLANRRRNAPEPDPSDIDRFWSHVDKSGECWTWTAFRNKTGYGMARWREQSTLANRVAWEISHGAIPEGLFVCHHCDNPSCVNPSHLFLGTNADNVRDKVAKGRQYKRLTIEQVNEIRRLFKAKEMNRGELAKRFGVSHTTICAVVDYRLWKHC